jgi:hypothetical protein
MPRYAPEHKDALLLKLLPPHNLSVAELSRQAGIATVEWHEILRAWTFFFISGLFLSLVMNRLGIVNISSECL